MVGFEVTVSAIVSFHELPLPYHIKTSSGLFLWVFFGVLMDPT